MMIRMLCIFKKKNLSDNERDRGGDLWHARAGHADCGSPICAKIRNLVCVFRVFAEVYQYAYNCIRLVKRKHYTCFCGSVFEGIDILVNSYCNKCLLKW